MVPIYFIRRAVLFVMLASIFSCANRPNINSDIKPIEMVLVPGGTFEMGDCWDYQDEDALPTHLVQIDSFYMSKYEITVGQYKQYAKEVGIVFESTDANNIPIRRINWDEAMAFCEYYGFRLPSEAEWEYAARNGGKKEWYSGTSAIGDEVDEHIVHLANSGEYVHPVGTKLPNGLGLYDMSGNVYEWIGNYYAQYVDTDGIDYIDLDKSKMRIIRGGCYSTFPIKNYVRTAVFHDQRSPRIGFRCVQSVNK